MFGRLTDRARRVLVLAQEEARLLHHPFIGCDHLLLGLVSEGRGVAARALVSAGMELEPVREVVRRLEGRSGPAIGSPPFTPGAKKVLELALRETLTRGEKSIDTEHLLFGLVSVEDGVVASTCAAFGTDGDDLRRRAEVVLAGGHPGHMSHFGGAEGPLGIIERFFGRLSARDWTGLGEVLAPDLERIGPFGDRVSGRARYLDLLAGSVPAAYGNDVHRVTYAPDGRSGFARVTEHLAYPDSELHLEEAYAFQFDETGVVARVEIFWQTPQFDRGGFGSATSRGIPTSDGTSGPDPASEAP